MAKRKTQLFRRDYPELEQLGEVLPRKAIAARLGMLRRDFDRALKADPNALLRLESGEARREARLVARLLELTESTKNPANPFFLLKSLHGYVDNPKPEAPKAELAVTFTLPAPMTNAQYRRQLEAKVEPEVLEGRLEEDGE